MQKWGKNRKRNHHGFTLIELMVVIVILGLLAAVVVPRILERPEQARVMKAKSDIAALESALRLYKLDNGSFPSTEQGLQALVEKPEIGKVPTKWKVGGYLEKNHVPNDPWQNEYVYLSPGTHGDFDIICYGADGVAGGDGEYDKDVNSWELDN